MSGSPKVHGLKRKASSNVESPGKQKLFKLDDASSIMSLTNSVAYGAHEVPDDYDLDDDMSTSKGESPLNFIQFDDSELNRENGVLFSEDLTEDYEIWTLQCPDDIDINKLLETSINFNGVSTLKIKNSMSDKVDLIPYRSQEETNITIVTPSERTKHLSLNVVPLAGKLIMSNRVKKEKLSNQKLLPVDTIEDATRRRSELMTKIIQRLSNKYNIKTNLKEGIKIERESPKKVRKNKKSQ